MTAPPPPPINKLPYVRDGDYAEFIQGGVLGPGEMPKEEPPSQAALAAQASLEQMQHSPSRSLAGWITSLATTAVLASVSYLALKERAVTMGGRNGPKSFEGAAAIVVGFLLLAAALWPIAKLTRHTRFAKLVLIQLAWIWLALLLLYLGGGLRWLTG